MERPLTALAFLPMVVVACQCVERGFEHADGSSGLVTDDDIDTSDDGATGPESAPPSEPPIDVSRFMGIFHNELDFIPFGREVPNLGDPTIANLEIRPDGTAHMRMENCSELFGTLEISLRWEARPGPSLEFSPGPGEESLRFMALTDLRSVHATLIDGCDLLFEIDGEPVPTEPFRPGRACWVNRCMPAWTVHIDYCPGEAPPPCE